MKHDRERWERAVEWRVDVLSDVDVAVEALSRAIARTPTSLERVRLQQARRLVTEAERVCGNNLRSARRHLEQSA